MNTQPFNPAQKEKTIALLHTKPGDVLRFAHDSLEDAFKSDGFWLRVDAPEAKERVRLVNIKDGKQLERDIDHRVIIHPATLHIAF